jgi:hypothetical protein
MDALLADELVCCTHSHPVYTVQVARTYNENRTIPGMIHTQSPHQIMQDGCMHVAFIIKEQDHEATAMRHCNVHISYSSFMATFWLLVGAVVHVAMHH